MQWKSTLHSPKPQHNCSLTIRLFNVISRPLVGGVWPLSRDAVSVFYSPTRQSWLLPDYREIDIFILNFTKQVTLSWIVLTGKTTKKLTYFLNIFQYILHTHYWLAQILSRFKGIYIYVCVCVYCTYWHLQIFTDNNIDLNIVLTRVLWSCDYIRCIQMVQPLKYFLKDIFKVTFLLFHLTTKKIY